MKLLGEERMGKQKSIVAELPKKKKSSLIKNKKIRKDKKSINKDSILQFKKDNRKTLKVEDTSPFTLNKAEINLIKNDILDNEGFSENLSWEEIDFYEISKPFTFVSVIQHLDTRDKRYILVEPPLNSKEKTIYDFIVTTLNTVSTNTIEIEKLGVTKVLEKLVDEIISDYSINVTGKEEGKLLYYLKKNLLGLAKLEPLMNDPQIEDISCDGSEVPLFLYHREHGSIQSNIQFTDEEELSGFVIKLSQKSGKHISIANPMIDATMPDGSRIQMTLGTEISTKGSTFTVRKFREEPFSPPDLVRFNTMSSEMIAYLWMVVEHGFNALISGGTASGKTSTLNALALFIPRESKIVSIEETREINLPHPNWIPGVTRSGFGEVVNARMVGEIDLFDLMKAALRQRPEYILVGEIRGKEAYVLFQAMATGHTTYSTVHADSTQDLIHRLEGKPINIPRTMLQSLDIVLIMRNQKTQDKQQRRCIKVVELLDIDNETNEVLTNIVFEWDPQQNQFIYTGKSYILEQIRSQIDMSAEEMTGELRQRADILQWMQNNHIRKFIDVTNILAKYAETPKKVLELITKEPEKIDEEIKESLFTIKSNFDSLLILPDVIRRNENAKEIEKSKQDNNSFIKSIFTRNQNKTKSSLNMKNLLPQSNRTHDDKIILKKKDEEEQSAQLKPVSNEPFFMTKKNPVSYFSKRKDLTTNSNQNQGTNLNELHSTVQKEIDEKLKSRSTKSSKATKKNSSDKKENASSSKPDNKKLPKSNQSQKNESKKKMNTLRKLSKTRIRIKKRKKLNKKNK